MRPNRVDDNEEVTTHSLELEPYHQMQFSVMPRTSLFLWGVGGVFPLNKEYNWCTKKFVFRVVLNFSNLWLEFTKLYIVLRPGFWLLSLLVTEWLPTQELNRIYLIYMYKEILH